MAIENKIEFLGRTGTEQLIAIVKDLLADKQASGDYALIDDVSTIIKTFGAISYNSQTLTDEQKDQVKENLGISSDSARHFARSVTLSAAGWVDNEQSVTIDGVLADAERCTVITGSDWSSAGVYDICGVCCIAQGDNSLTFQCTYVPDEDIVVNVTVLI